MREIIMQYPWCAGIICVYMVVGAIIGLVEVNDDVWLDSEPHPWARTKLFAGNVAGWAWIRLIRPFIAVPIWRKMDLARRNERRRRAGHPPWPK